MLKSKRAILALAALLPPAIAHAEQRQLGAHVHGHGALNIAIEGNTVSMELDAPGMDIAGFEHKASDAEDKAKAEAAQEALKNGAELFALPASADCKLEKSDVALEQEGPEAADTPDHEKDHASDAHTEHAEDHSAEAEVHHDGHNAYNATYVLTCAQPSEIRTIRFNYFKAFPGAKSLTVNLVSADRQASFEVSRDSPTLDLQEGM